MFWSREPIPPDVGEILQTAALLEITEFRVFDLAYAAWFGRQADDATLEPYFIAYMFEETVPYWVRHFTRGVLARAQGGDTDPTRYGLPIPQAPPRAVINGTLVMLVVAAAVTLLLLVVIQWGNLPTFLKSCYFPPCY
jgi:hypothetical protein